ncbi:MAG: 50S ribosomal protein L4 [Alphaproteobacteria bacterium]
MAIKARIIDLSNAAAGEIALDEGVFGQPVRKDILARVVNWQLAKRRQGSASTKGISDIRGTTKKPHAQKGSGSARQGSLRSPQFRGGAVIFGPKPRDFSHKLPKKVRALGLKSALSAKQADGKLVILKDTALSGAKTKELAANLKNLGWQSTLIIGGAQIDEAFQRAARNIPNLDVLPSVGVNVYDILRRDTLVLTEEAVSRIQERLK